MNDPEKEQYKSLLSEIIAKQRVILGPEVAIFKARNVSALTVADDGTVTDVQGDPQQAIQKLIDEYVNLSGLIVKSALDSILAKYPNFKKSP